MNIEDFIWLEEIEDKLTWKHDLQPHEVEEAFFNRPHFEFVERGYRRGRTFTRFRAKPLQVGM